MLGLAAGPSQHAQPVPQLSRDLRCQRLLQVRRRFEESGGAVREFVAAEGVTVHPDGVSLDVQDGAITARLLVDCMGNFGPIVRQVHQLPKTTKRGKDELVMFLNPEKMETSMGAWCSRCAPWC